MMLDQFVNGEKLFERILEQLDNREDKGNLTSREGLLKQLAQSPCLQSNDRWGVTVYYQVAQIGPNRVSYSIHKQLFELKDQGR